MANQYNVTEADHIALLKFIKGYTKTYGYPPTIREMIEPLGLASTCPTRLRLEKLEEFDWIQRAPGVARGIRITNKGRQAVKQHDQKIRNSMLMANLKVSNLGR
jgi:repressor LexA